MAKANVTRTVSVPGMTLSEINAREGDTLKRITLTLPVGFLATLTTRTTDHSGLCVLEAGHNIESDYSTVDLYSSAGVLLVRDCDVTAVVGNLVTFDGVAVGAGMPNTPGLEFTCSKQISTALVIEDTSLIEAVAYTVNPFGNVPDATEAAEACVQFQDTGSDYDQVLSVPLIPTGLENIFDIEGGDVDSPILDTPAVTSLVASNPLQTNRCTLQFGCLLTSDS